ncbi:hypothetical protein Godav_028531 [Gossypium davidsonii]|uniref:Uncharacterized protein n=2 Tax=Gossypium TaxID=3633 RepID=A0A7J8S0F7_GOSDV|nr:hypothetical protein [Gossypium davidsonii]MBA0654724.1 hypothetical protein [Gossypium klotzschianum]
MKNTLANLRHPLRWTLIG